MTEMDDFGDVGAIQQTGDGAVYWDALLSDLLTELEAISIGTAHIQNATLSADRPLRFASGTPVFLEQFELGNKLWWNSSSGAGGSAARSTDHYRSKGASTKLVAGSSLSRYALCYALEGLFSLVKMGAQVAFTLHADVDYIEFYFTADSGADYYQPRVKLDLTNTRVQVYNGSLAWETVLTTWAPTDSLTAFHYVKVICDFSTGLYSTLYVDNQEAGLSAIGLPLIVGAALDFTRIQTTVYGTVDNNPEVYVDDFCLTLED